MDELERRLRASDPLAELDGQLPDAARIDAIARMVMDRESAPSPAQIRKATVPAMTPVPTLTGSNAGGPRRSSGGRFSPRLMVLVATLVLALGALPFLAGGAAPESNPPAHLLATPSMSVPPSTAFVLDIADAIEASQPEIIPFAQTGVIEGDITLATMPLDPEGYRMLSLLRLRNAQTLAGLQGDAQGPEAAVTLDGTTLRYRLAVNGRLSETGIRLLLSRPASLTVVALDPALYGAEIVSKTTPRYSDTLAAGSYETLGELPPLVDSLGGGSGIMRLDLPPSAEPTLAPLFEAAGARRMALVADGHLVGVFVRPDEIPADFGVRASALFVALDAGAGAVLFLANEGLTPENLANTTDPATPSRPSPDPAGPVASAPIGEQTPGTPDMTELAALAPAGVQRVTTSSTPPDGTVITYKTTWKYAQIHDYYVGWAERNGLVALEVWPGLIVIGTTDPDGAACRAVKLGGSGTTSFADCAGFFATASVFDGSVTVVYHSGL